MPPTCFGVRSNIFVVFILLLSNTINFIDIITAEINIPLNGITNTHSSLLDSNSSNKANIYETVGISEKNMSTNNLISEHKNSEAVTDTIIDSNKHSTYDFSQRSHRLTQDIQDFQSQIVLENMPLFNFRKDLSQLINETISCTNHGYDTVGHLNDLLTLETVFYDYLNLLRDYYFNLFEAKLKNYDTDENNDLSSTSMEGLHQRVQYYEEMKAYMTNEFYSALKASQPDAPECRSWNIEGFLVELRDDMDTCIADKTAPYARRVTITSQGGNDDVDAINIHPSSSSAAAATALSANNNNSTTISIKTNMPWKRKKRLLSFSLPHIPLPSFIQHIIRHHKVKKYGKWLALQSLLFGVNFLQNEMHRRSALYAAEKRHAEVPPFPLL